MRLTRHPYEIEGWGVGELWVRGGRVVVAHDPPRNDVALHEVSPREGRGRFVPGVLGSIHRYFDGEPVSFAEVPLEEEWGTPFQAALTDALRQVPWGEVLSYGELAARAGRRGAARAAGTFCAGNRFSLFVPCHRVVAADGIGGYGELGRDYKRRLLLLEGHDAL